MNIIFFIRHFTERGSEIAIYDYAKYNEEILKNKSYIMCFSKNTQEKLSFGNMRHSFEKFNSRFDIIEVSNFLEIKNAIDNLSIDFFYTLTHGGKDIYNFENKNIWGKCKTIKHAIFDTTFPESDFYVSISNTLNSKFKTNVPVIPHIVSLPDSDKNLREELGISKEKIVLGRYGGYDTFNIRFVKNAIVDFLDKNDNIVFLFMNTETFYEHPNIIYLNKNIDLLYKTKFINTCDAMMHARFEGESFGLSIGEFSSKNKPIITCKSTIDNEHIHILKDKAIIYTDLNSLLNIFMFIKQLIYSKDNWNCYNDFSPENVMRMFNNLFNNSVINK